MNPEDLKRNMRFSHPDENVSMRNRNYRWTQPTYEIKNIRRDAEDPNNSTIYYEDMKGNKYKTNAQMFINRFSDFYIESSIKYAIKLLAQTDYLYHGTSLKQFEKMKENNFITKKIYVGDNIENITEHYAERQAKVDESNPVTLYFDRNRLEKIMEQDIHFLINEEEIQSGQFYFSGDMKPALIKAIMYDYDKDENIELSLEKIATLNKSIKLLAQVPGYDSPTPAVENENPASIPRSCPNCGYMAMGSEINAVLEKGEQELKCPRCGFSINVAPDEQFLMARKKMLKLKNAIDKFSQWKENIMDLSDELYYPTVPEMEDPKMNRIRELEEELGLEPIELSDLGVSADEYLAYLEDEASGLINMAKKEAAFDLSFAPEFFGDVYQWTSPGKLPTNVADAIMYFWETDRERFKNMIKELFPDWDHLNINLDTLSEGLTMEIMDKIMETNTCGDLASPVDVWIDPEGFYTVDVYDEQTEEKETEEGLETEGTWFSLVNEGR